MGKDRFLSDAEISEIRAKAEDPPARRFMPPDMPRASDVRPRVLVQTIEADRASGDASLALALERRAATYHVVSMRWLDDGSVRVVWERR